MIWIGLGIAIAGFFIGLGLEELGEHIEKRIISYYFIVEF